ncbi:MAG: DNA recombination protein RmuC [Candidatus Roizmanbacteria bacterium]|nr:DNA recombination protein RmuC [Candidatus Roizmanbacteria bacterium]
MNLTVIVLVFGISVLIILLFIKSWLNRLEEKTTLSSDVVDWLKTSNLSVDQKLSKNLEIFASVQKSIGEFSEIGRSMKELQEYLTSPKLRGNIGEHVLKELLAQNFPKSSYKLQYHFKTGAIVDAVLITTQGLIPIDSKFPIDTFKKIAKASNKEEIASIKKDFERDVKRHVDDIARKYILAEEKTVDYALMYIPSESVYYELINNEGVFDYAGQNRVLPVSPMSFYAYIKAILISFEGEKIETKAKEILKILQAIKKDYQKTDEALSVLNKHVTNAYNQSSQVTKTFSSLGQKLDSTNLLTIEKEEKLID